MLGLFSKAKDRTAHVHTQDASVQLTVEKGKTLLNAALDAGVDWPHRCKVGSCGTCKCQVTSGTVKPQIDFGYVLSPEELESGFVLACQSELKSDVEVQVTLRKKRKVL